MRLTDEELEQAKARGWRFHSHAGRVFADWAERGISLCRSAYWTVDDGPCADTRHELLTKPVDQIRADLRAAEGAK